MFYFLSTTPVVPGRAGRQQVARPANDHCNEP